MDGKPLAYIVGNSLLMDGIAESLTQAGLTQIVYTDPSIPDLAESVRRLRPHLIVFELNSPNSQPILALLHQLPGTLLIGLDLTCSRAIVINSRESQAQTSRELLEAFLAETGSELDLSEGEQMAKKQDLVP